MATGTEGSALPPHPRNEKMARSRALHLADKLGADRGWQPVAGWQLVLVAVFGGMVLYLGNTGERWIPVLDSANLAFHEAGHPLFWLLNDRLGVYGGTLGQLALPLIVAASFWRRRDAFATSIALVWLFQNFFNIARYMADARARVLPLVGGDHDWTEIFTRWHVLHLDTRIAGLVGVLGWAGLLMTCCALARLWWRQRAADGPHSGWRA
ncbi:MAG: hypothetical protein KDI45_12140 [Candidatus Accumulibacter sp.]|nr:hypothetical protein [Accumulibacter sp.]